MPNLTEEVIKLVDPNGFDEVFDQFSYETGLPGDMVFKIMNDLYLRTYGVQRYSSYDSYRVVRNRRIREKRN